MLLYSLFFSLTGLGLLGLSTTMILAAGVLICASTSAPLRARTTSLLRTVLAILLPTLSLPLSLLAFLFYDVATARPFSSLFPLSFSVCLVKLQMPGLLILRQPGWSNLSLLWGSPPLLASPGPVIVFAVGLLLLPMLRAGPLLSLRSMVAGLRGLRLL